MIQLLGTAHPIIQAPMAGVSTPALAAAVSNAGGLGSLGIGANTAPQAKSAILQTRSLTDQPFNVNVFCNVPPHRSREAEGLWIKHFARVFEKFDAPAPEGLSELFQTFLSDDYAFRMLLELRPAFVSFHFGLPAAQKIAALREAGIRTLATATSVDEARAVKAAGIDGVIAQGIEAGGHRGIFDPCSADEQLGTMALVRQLVRSVELPIIAAGGIMDGRGIKQALENGATAAQLGTAFVLCPESSADEAYRAILKSYRCALTTLTSVVSGRPARGILNELIKHGETAAAPPPPAYPLAYDLARQLDASAKEMGDREYGAYWAGQGAPLARALPAGQLVRLLAEELAAAH